MSDITGGVKNWCQFTNISILFKKPSRVPPELSINKIAPTLCKSGLSKYRLKKAYFTPTLWSH